MRGIISNTYRYWLIESFNMVFQLGKRKVITAVKQDNVPLPMKCAYLFFSLSVVSVRSWRLALLSERQIMLFSHLEASVSRLMGHSGLQIAKMNVDAQRNSGTVILSAYFDIDKRSEKMLR